VEVVRPAGVEDANAIAGIHVRSWQAAYRGLIPDDVLDGLSVERRTETWRGWLATASPVAVWVAEEEGGRIVGFVSAGPSEDRDAAEIQAIYVEPDRSGRGIGRALLRRAVDELRAGGHAEVVLWVLDGNDRAQRFYEAAGWRADGGAKVEAMEGVDLSQVRYRLSLAAGPTER
jgi:ribosomal protein S18 acetylase RimI-like enzyme